MTDEYRSRRRFLRGASAAATATLAGLAGCVGRDAGGGDGGSGRSPGTGTGTDGGTGTGTTGTGTDPRTYTDWLPAPGALDAGSDVYSFSRLDVGQVVANRDRFDPAEYRSLAGTYGAAGTVFPPVEAVDGVTSAVVSRRGTLLLVVEGSFSAADAAQRLTDRPGRPFEPSGEYGGYDLYAGEDGVFGVDDGVLAGTTSNREGAEAMTRTLVDAGRGEADRLVETNAEADRLATELGDPLGAFGTLAPGNLNDGFDPASLAAAGQSAHLTDEGARFDLVLLYGNADAVDGAAIETTARESAGTMGRTRDLSVSVSGRLATVTGVVDAERLTFGTFSVGIAPDPDETPPAPPQASFAFEYDREAGSVTVTHEGGEAFTAENTGALLYGTPADRRGWPLPARAGDSVTVQGVESGDDVVVLWESPAGDRIPVGDYTVP